MRGEAEEVSKGTKVVIQKAIISYWVTIYTLTNAKDWVFAKNVSIICKI